MAMKMEKVVRVMKTEGVVDVVGMEDAEACACVRHGIATRVSPVRKLHIRRNGSHT
jgi:hypothetical protein